MTVIIVVRTDLVKVRVKVRMTVIIVIVIVKYVVVIVIAKVRDWANSCKSTPPHPLAPLQPP